MMLSMLKFEDIKAMSTNQVKQGYITPDNVVHATAADARNHLRKPQVTAALLAVAGGDSKLSTFLFENSEDIAGAFEAGTVSRVTKVEKNKLKKALEHLKTVDDPKLRFLQENADAVEGSFRWPAVKRMDDAEKAAETLRVLTTLSSAEAATWIVANKEAILKAFDAGVEKRVVNPKAMEALAVHRAAQKVISDAKKLAEAPAKAVAEAAKAAKKAAEAAAK
jgi:hypothetical protein